MKTPSFFEGVLLAVVASISADVLFVALRWLMPVGQAPGLLIAGLSFAYCVYLLVRSRERVGRMTVLAVWIALSGTVWLWSPPLPLFLLIHLGMVWLVRSLYFQTGLVAALADLALSGFGLAAALWAVTTSGSLLLAVWCFFLVQALFVAIPNGKGRTQAPVESVADDRFQQAYRTAEAALRKIATGPSF